MSSSKAPLKNIREQCSLKGWMMATLLPSNTKQGLPHFSASSSPQSSRIDLSFWISPRHLLARLTNASTFGSCVPTAHSPDWEGICGRGGPLSSSEQSFVAPAAGGVRLVAQRLRVFADTSLAEAGAAAGAPAGSVDCGARSAALPRGLRAE